MNPQVELMVPGPVVGEHCYRGNKHMPELVMVILLLVLIMLDFLHYSYRWDHNAKRKLDETS